MAARKKKTEQEQRISLSKSGVKGAHQRAELLKSKIETASADRRFLGVQEQLLDRDKAALQARYEQLQGEAAELRCEIASHIGAAPERVLLDFDKLEVVVAPQG